MMSEVLCGVIVVLILFATFAKKGLQISVNDQTYSIKIQELE